MSEQQNAAAQNILANEVNRLRAALDEKEKTNVYLEKVRVALASELTTRRADWANSVLRIEAAEREAQGLREERDLLLSKAGWPGLVDKLYVDITAQAQEIKTLRTKLDEVTEAWNTSHTEADRLLAEQAAVIERARECIRQHGQCGWDCNWYYLANALAALPAPQPAQDSVPCAHANPSEPKHYPPCPQCGYASPNIAAPVQGSSSTEKGD